MERADSSYKHVNAIGILGNNQYGDDPGTYCYKKGLMVYIKKHEAVRTRRERCLMRKEFKVGTAMAVVAVHDFLVAVTKNKTTDGLHDIMKPKENMKRLEIPKKILDW